MAARYVYGLVESVIWALFIPAAVIAVVGIVIVTRMVLRRPTPRTVTPRPPVPAAQEEAPTPQVVLAPLDARLAELIRAKASCN